MTAPAYRSFVASNVPFAQSEHKEAPMHIATRKNSHAMDFRRVFARKWSVFIRENFSSTKEVQQAFGVDRATSENWWEGRNAPQGWAVGFAMTCPRLGPEVSRCIGE